MTEPERDVYLGLCTMCSPRGISASKVCPTCGSCPHICRGGNGNPCSHQAQVQRRLDASKEVC